MQLGDVETTDVTAYVECRTNHLPELITLAKGIDRFVGAEPPPDGYGLGEAVCAIFNGGTHEDIQLALRLLTGWNFKPEGGWPREERRAS